MSEQIDWSKAPAEAMVLLKHVRDDSYAWAVSHSEDARAWHKWNIRCSFHLMAGMWSVVAERPTTPSWSGEGLPPVGAVCEVDWCEEWHKCEVIAHFQQRCGMVAAFTVEISYGVKSLYAFGADSFRPIRTPEQIAADQREAQIVAIHDAIVTSVKVTLGQCDSWRKVAEMVYDAGFKRPE